MNHPLSRAFALVVALAATAPVSRAAHACGGYGSASIDVAIVQQQAFDAARSMQARDRAASLAAFTASATASHEYRGCCQPPTFSAGDWLTQRFADRTWRIGTLSSVSRSGSTIVATFSNGVINTVPSTHQFTFATDDDAQWKISRVYTARATRQA